MAVDEVLLDLVASDPTAAWLRTYGWSTPTLSLGYFQRRGRCAGRAAMAVGGQGPAGHGGRCDLA